MLPTLDNLLPEKITRLIQKIGPERVYEIRLRSGRASRVNVGGRFFYLGGCGASAYRGDALIVSEKEVDEIVAKAAEHSVYACQHQLSQAFLSVEGGIRVGVCGKAVVNDPSGTVEGVGQYGSVVVRIPHEVEGCSGEIDLGDGSILISSRPGMGKTTFLRDLARRFSVEKALNVAVIDERGEIAACRNGVPQLDVGDSDVLTDCPKRYGLLQAVRVLRPDVLITDELSGKEDLIAAEEVRRSGVRIVASVHAGSIREALLKTSELCKFDRIVQLRSADVPGKIERIEEQSL